MSCSSRQNRTHERFSVDVLSLLVHCAYLHRWRVVTTRQPQQSSRPPVLCCPVCEESRTGPQKSMLQTQTTGSKGCEKGFTKDCRSTFSASADSMGFSANMNGTGISVDAGGSAGDEENNDDKDKVMYVFKCNINIEIIAIKPPVDSADRTHALGRRLLPDGKPVFYDLVVMKSTVVHGHPPDGCTWDDLPNNNSFP